MSEGQIKDMILKQCLELTTNNDFRPPISAYDGIDIDDVVRTCKQLQDKKTYLDLLKENQELKEKLDKYENPEDMTLFAMWCTEKVKDENLELKKQLEEYKATNKILSHELTKDKVLQQDCLTTCCGIPIGDIPKLITQQKEFIEWLEAMSKMYENEYKDIDIAGHYNCALPKYKEIIGHDK